MKKIVFTGGPGVGKTTTAEYLGQFGFYIVREPARDIIEAENTKNQLDSSHTQLHKRDYFAFAMAVMREQLDREAKVPAGIEAAICDGALGDIAGYLRTRGFTPPEELISRIKRADY